MKSKKEKFQKIYDLIHGHIHKVWPDRVIEFYSWELGPILKSMPEFRVARIEPNDSTQSWVYISAGMSEVVRIGGHGVELFLLSPFKEALHVELFAMLVNYCCDPATPELNLHSIFDIGRPWIEGSDCDHILVSLPYTLGPRVEWLSSGPNKKIRVLWALPISAKEASFAKLNGVEALEKKFDSWKINPVDPNRPSVVTKK